MSTFDVAIAGGGLIGVSIAWELAGAGLHVVVLDRQEPGREASWAAAGMLAPAPESERDISLTELGIASLDLYPNFSAAIENESKKTASYATTGTREIFDASSQRDQKFSLYQRLGIRAEVTFTDGREGIWLPDEASVDPRALFSAALAAAKQRGVEIRGACAVSELFFERGCCIGVFAGEKIVAKHVVIAAGCFSGKLLATSKSGAAYAPTRPVRGQMIALRKDGVSLSHVLRSATGYLVPRADGRIVAGSTSEEAGFEKETTPQGLQKIFNTAVNLCPALKGAEFAESWSGLRPGTPDDLPIVGPTDIPGLLVATGHYRNGILLAPITAQLVRKWVLGEPVETNMEQFSPLRFRKENWTKNPAAI